MRGKLERLKDNNLGAYRLSQHSKEDSERLRQYILQEHRRMHPSLHQ